MMSLGESRAPREFTSIKEAVEDFSPCSCCLESWFKTWFSVNQVCQFMTTSMDLSILAAGRPPMRDKT